MRLARAPAWQRESTALVFSALPAKMTYKRLPFCLSLGFANVCANSILSVTLHLGIAGPFF